MAPHRLTRGTTAGAGTLTVAGSAAFSPILMNTTPAPQATGATGPALGTVAATPGGIVMTNVKSW